MFSADLSWADDATEKVGERRQRKVRDGDESITSSTSSQNKDRRPQTRNKSLSGKTSFSSVKGSFRRPSTSATRHIRQATLPTIEPNTPWKDPLDQPDFTLSGKYIPKLPSGTQLDGDPPPPFNLENNVNTSDHGRIYYSRQENNSREFGVIVARSELIAFQRKIHTELGRSRTRGKQKISASLTNK